MKIALVIDKLDEARGGAARWTIRLGQWLVLRGHVVHFVANRASDELKTHYDVTLVDRSRNPVKNASRFDHTLRELDIDVVHDMGVGTQFDLLQSHIGSPIAHDAVRDAICTPIQRVHRRLFASRRERQRKALHQRQFTSDRGRFLAVSPKVAKDMVDFEGVSPDRIDVVCNGVDTGMFVSDHTNLIRQNTRTHLGIKIDQYLLLLVAHNHRLKGLPTIMKALDALPPEVSSLQLLVAGGPSRKERRIGRHSIRWLGNVADMLPLYQSVDALVHPTRYDACSLCVLEAMACGLPTITTPENGVCHVLDDGKNGLVLQDSLDWQTLSQQIVSLDDPTIRSQIGLNARETARAWQAEDNFREIERLYRSILRLKKVQSGLAA